MMKTSCKCHLCTTQGCRCHEYALFFDLLGSGGRIHIINALRTGPKNVTQICELSGIEQTAVSHNLKRLQTANFVTSERDGKFVIYRLTAQTHELMNLIDKHVKKHDILSVLA